MGGGDGTAATAAAEVAAAPAGAGAGAGTADGATAGGYDAGSDAGAGPISARCRGSRSGGTRAWPNGASVETCVESTSAGTGSSVALPHPGGCVFGLTTLARTLIGCDGWCFMVGSIRCDRFVFGRSIDLSNERWGLSSMAEHAAHTRLVGGSTPSAPTTISAAICPCHHIRADCSERTTQQSWLDESAMAYRSCRSSPGLCDPHKEAARRFG